MIVDLLTTLIIKKIFLRDISFLMFNTNLTMFNINFLMLNINFVITHKKYSDKLMRIYLNIY